MAFDPAVIPAGEHPHLAFPVPPMNGPGGPTPEDAMASYTRGSKSQFPRVPYEQRRLSNDRVLFTYAVDGLVKIAVTIGPNHVDPGYRWLQFAECNPEEAALAGDRIEAWSDKHGKPVSTRRTVGQSAALANDKCNGAGVSLLWLGDGQPFIRDPEGTFLGKTRGPYESTSVLPVDARDTGLRRGPDALWLAANESAVFLVRRGTVEQLPREYGERGLCV
jgi:hypothetical protein